MPKTIVSSHRVRMRGVIAADKLIGISLLCCLAILGLVMTHMLLNRLLPQSDLPIYEAGNVSDERIILALTDEPGSWLSYGQTYEERRYSTLSQIDRETVSALRLAWYRDLDQRHELQGTPLMVDGTLYFTDAWSVVYAVDARDGTEIWTFDPGTRREFMRHSSRGGPQNRGLAVHSGKVYVATLDARLVAIDAQNGEALWEADTTDAGALNPFTITAAPRVAAGKVFIGQSAAADGHRGYVSAFDAETGDLVWRFWLVPGDPSRPFEHPAMARAASSWSGNWWESGGGGAVWNSIVYDPSFNTLYLGVGSGTPGHRRIRSPEGGDNLYISAIVAVNPDIGRMKWFYQTVPGDNWHYGASADMTLTEMEIEGRQRKVLLQATENGYFYVIDRSDGSLLRADPYAEVSWAQGVNRANGRPVENPSASYEDQQRWILPGRRGAHGWQAMAVDQGRTTAYIATHDEPSLYTMPDSSVDGEVAADDASSSPLSTSAPPLEPRGQLKAFDYATGNVKWSVSNRDTVNGGTLASAGGLVFQGDGAGYISAYDDDSGDLLWEFASHGKISAPPISYAVDGRQYIAIMASANADHVAGGRLLVFTLGGDATLPPPQVRDLTIPEQSPLVLSENELARGSDLYRQFCAFCHGAQVRAGTMAPDLRRMDGATHDAFQAIVREGLYADRGMEDFSDQLTEMEAELIHQYIRSRATQDREAQLGQ